MSPPIAARRSPSGASYATSRPLAISATLSHSSASPRYWVVTSIVRPSDAEPMQLLPDPGPEQRVDARGRLVEEHERRLVDQRAGKLEAALHAPGQVAGTPAARVPQVDDLEDRARPSVASAEQHPEQRGHEVDVLARRQVRVQREQLRHVADLLAGPCAGTGAGPRRGHGPCRSSERGPRSASGRPSSCRPPTGR